jgi:hypothetical protein
MPLYNDTKRDRWVYEFDRQIIQQDGSKRRVRSRRTFPKGISEIQARALAQKYEANGFVKAEVYDNHEVWVSYVSKMMADPRSWIFKTLVKIRSRAKELSRTCSIDAKDIEVILLSSGGRCAVTGLKFDLSECNGQGKRPFYHSVDRIDSSKGYTTNNIRLVCLAANIAMLHWGESVLSEVATGYVMRKYAISSA